MASFFATVWRKWTRSFNFHSSWRLRLTPYRVSPALGKVFSDKADAFIAKDVRWAKGRGVKFIGQKKAIQQLLLKNSMLEIICSFLLLRLSHSWWSKPRDVGDFHHCRWIQGWTALLKRIIVFCGNSDQIFIKNKLVKQVCKLHTDKMAWYSNRTKETSRMKCFMTLLSKWSGNC